MSASDQRLEVVLEVCEGAEKIGVALVCAGLILELAIAVANPAYGSSVERFGPAIADAAVAIGVVIEALASLRAGLCQGERVRRANEQTTKLEKEAAEARERTAKLEALTSWRRVSLAEAKALGDALSDRAKASIVFWIWSGDAESAFFAKELSTVFRHSGWNAGITYCSYASSPVFGIWIPTIPRNTEEVNPRGLAKDVQAAFEGARIKFFGGPMPEPSMTVQDDNHVPGPWVDVYVGPRPPIQIDT